MNIFNFRTTEKQIEIFERNVAEILKIDFPEIKEVLELSIKLSSIQFMKKPCGIYLSHGYSTKNYQKINPEHKTNFDLFGLEVFNNKLNEYEEIVLFFQNGTLSLIEVKNPKKFHKTYDYTKLRIGKLRKKEVSFENQDKKITQEILKNVSKVKLNQLEIEDTIEIEYNQNLYYTILDMENGNYVAVDKTGKVYRLNHEQTEKVKKISNTIDEFFDLYNGSKSNLIEILHKQKAHSLYGNTN